MRLIPIVFLLGCASTTAESPLTVQLGVPRDQAVAELHKHQYCRKDGPPEKLETLARCDRPGTEWGDSWVTTRYEGEMLVELRRFERYADEGHATERWNQLVMERSKLAPDAPDARALLDKRGALEPGTKTVKAWQLDADTIVAVYLLTPTPPENANVLEAIVRVPK